MNNISNRTFIKRLLINFFILRTTDIIDNYWVDKLVTHIEGVIH